MSQLTEKESDSLLYRFIDSGEGSNLQDRDQRVLRVEFYQSVDDFVKIAEKMANEFPLPSFGKLALQGFVVLNQIGTPAILFAFDLWLPAVIVFVLNTLLLVGVLPAINKADYRRYYLHHFKDLERHIATVEIHPRGLWYQAGSASSFISWDNFTSVEEEEETIYFYMLGGNGIPVRKNGFAYEVDKNEFVALALERVGSRRELEHGEPG